MPSSQVQLLINCISSLTESDKSQFFSELEKIEKPVSKTMPKKTNLELVALLVEDCQQQFLTTHRKQYQSARKLA